MLRQSYNQDPYPNQARIEQLANQLGVGTKTVVNWFHNHRMRAKQHPNASGGSPARAQSPSTKAPLTPSSDRGSGSPDSQATPTVSKPRPDYGDESNQSVEQSQWIFPTYEPVPMRAKDGESLSPSTANNNNTIIDNKGKDGAAADNDNEQYDYMAATSSKESAGKSSSKGGGSRRKSTRPQWLYEGVQLDKGRVTSPDSDDPYTDKHNSIDGNHGNEATSLDLSIDKQEDTENSHAEMDNDKAESQQDDWQDNGNHGDGDKQTDVAMEETGDDDDSASEEWD